MATRIYLLPGIGGSPLEWFGAQGFPIEVWGENNIDIGLTQLIPISFDRLPLTAAGASKYDIRPHGPLHTDFYGDVTALLSRDFDVVQLPYDWRLLPSQIAATLKISAPGYFVAHSMGGLVAAQLYSLLKSRSEEYLFQGLIACGTPWALDGESDAVEVCFGEGKAVGLLAALYLVGKLFVPGPSILKFVLGSVLDPQRSVLEVMLSWSSVSTLLPNDPSKYRALDTYATTLEPSFITQQWLDRGRDEKNACLAAAEAMPQNLIAEVRGVGIPTDVDFPVTSQGDGDGVVLARQSLKQYPVFAIPDGAHTPLMNYDDVAAVVKLLIDQNYTTKDVLDLDPLTSRGVTWRPNPYGSPPGGLASSYSSIGPGRQWPDP